jgi:hypothetical protein
MADRRWRLFVMSLVLAAALSEGACDGPGPGADDPSGGSQGEGGPAVAAAAVGVVRGRAAAMRPRS